MGIASWLKDVGLPQYADSFESNEITPDLIRELDHETLKDLGVDVLGHRLMILRAAKDAKPAQETPAQSHPKWDAERRQLTIAFCDMVGSTQISSQLDPEEFRDLIRLYHETVSDAATRAGGHVAQFLGDGSMIYFGYPTAQEDATERAVNMGLALIDALERLQPHPGIGLQTRIGIATGLVVVGDLVGRGLYEGAVVSGDAPNLAARLQAVAEPGQIIVGERTHHLLGRSFDSIPLEPLELKGIPGLTKAWRIVGPSVSANRFEARRNQSITPLVGRDDDLKRLLDGWERALDGNGHVMMLRGEAGLGKSRLLRELKQRSGMSGPSLVQLHCSPYYSNTSLHPVTRALEFGAGFERDDSPDTRLDKILDYFDLAPETADEQGALIAGLMGLPADRFPPLKISVALQRKRLFETMLGLILRASEASPVMLFFEDLHWADPTTLQLLEKMIETAPKGRIFVVGTYRPDFVPPWGETAGVTLCDLRRLNQNQMQSLIGKLTSDTHLSEEIVATLTARADGIPFFAEELTKSVLQLDWRTVNAVPSTLRDTLMARLDALDGPRQVAQIASVIGREFDLDLLGAVTGKNRTILLGALEQLAESDLIFRAKGRDTWVFRHALIRDAAYESLLNRSRQDMHLKIAHTVKDRYPERAHSAPEFLARHFGEAGEHASAAKYWLTAGTTARQKGIVSEAHAHIAAGLEHTARMPESPDRETIELQLHVGHGMVLSGIKGHGSPDVGAAFNRAGALNARGTSPDFRLAFHNGHGAHLAMRGEVLEGHTELSKTADVAKDDPRLLISAGSSLSWSHFSRGEFANSIAWGERVEGYYDAGHWQADAPRHTTGDPRVITRCWHAASLWSLGFPDQAMSKAQSALDYAKTLNDPYSRIYAQVNGVCRLAALQGRTEMVLDVATDAIAYAKRMGYDFAAGYGLFWQAEAMAQTGDLETALKMIDATIAACEAMSFLYHGPHFKAMQAIMLSRSGDQDAALGKLEGLEARVEESGELWQGPDVSCARATVSETGGDLTTAQTASQVALVKARAMESRAWELRAATKLADLLARRGQTDQAHDLLAPLYEWFTEGFDTADLKRAKTLLSRLEAPEKETEQAE